MARSGLYVKLDTNFPDDDKIEAVGFAGAGLYAMALCVAKRVMTDGRLTRAKLRKLGAPDELVERLISAHLLTADPASDDVWITAWLGHNEAADAIETKRAEEAARKRLSRAKRPAGHADTVTERPAGQPDTEEKRREEKRTTATGSGPKRKTGPPDALPVSDGMREWAAKNNVTVNLEAETDRFLDWHRGRGSLMKDWTAAWRNWMGNTKRFPSPNATGATRDQFSAPSL